MRYFFDPLIRRLREKHRSPTFLTGGTGREP
jgi:hypothetical protein